MIEVGGLVKRDQLDDARPKPGGASRFLVRLSVNSALRGRANDAIVILRGLVSGMELSAGSAVAGGTWQLSATDLLYAWIAPPKDLPVLLISLPNCGCPMPKSSIALLLRS